MLTRGEVAVHGTALQVLATVERAAVPGLAIEDRDSARRSHDVFLVGVGRHLVDLCIAGIEALVGARHQTRTAIFPAEVVQQPDRIAHVKAAVVVVAPVGVQILQALSW